MIKGKEQIYRISATKLNHRTQRHKTRCWGFQHLLWVEVEWAT